MKNIFKKKEITKESKLTKTYKESLSKVFDNIYTSLNKYNRYTDLVKSTNQKSINSSFQISEAVINYKYNLNILSLFSLINPYFPKNNYIQIENLINQSKISQDSLKFLNNFKELLSKEFVDRYNVLKQFDTLNSLTKFSDLKKDIPAITDTLVELLAFLNKQSLNIPFNLDQHIKDNLQNQISKLKKSLVFYTVYNSINTIFFANNSPYKNYLNKETLNDLQKYFFSIVDYYVFNESNEITAKLVNNLRFKYISSPEFNFVHKYCLSLNSLLNSSFSILLNNNTSPQYFADLSSEIQRLTFNSIDNFILETRKSNENNIEYNNILRSSYEFK
jgi:hypothetical protein